MLYCNWTYFYFIFKKKTIQMINLNVYHSCTNSFYQFCIHICTLVNHIKLTFMSKCCKRWKHTILDLLYNVECSRYLWHNIACWSLTNWMRIPYFLVLRNAVLTPWFSSWRKIMISVSKDSKYEISFVWSISTLPFIRD